jgi:hypothetical protein
VSTILASSGRRRVVVESLTRPNDVNAYAAKDWLANAVANPARMGWDGVTILPGGTGVITAASLATTDTAWTARLRLHLWAAPQTVGNDNAAAARDKDADLAFYLGHISFLAPVVEGSGDEFAFDQQLGLYLPYYCSAGTTIYGQMETLDGITPVAQAVYRVALSVEMDG